jgi:hypothetical protein
MVRSFQPCVVIERYGAGAITEHFKDYQPMPEGGFALVHEPE